MLASRYCATPDVKVWLSIWPEVAVLPLNTTGKVLGDQLAVNSRSPVVPLATETAICGVVPLAPVQPAKV